jgi:hypothetical protein
MNPLIPVLNKIPYYLLAGGIGVGLFVSCQEAKMPENS